MHGMSRRTSLAEMAGIGGRGLACACTAKHPLEHCQAIVVGNHLFKSDGSNVQLWTRSRHVGIAFVGADDNVTRLASYNYFSSEATGGELPEGWYILDSNGDPDFDAGPQEFEFAAGQGFVVNSVNSSAVLQFPSAM